MTGDRFYREPPADQHAPAADHLRDAMVRLASSIRYVEQDLADAGPDADQQRDVNGRYLLLDARTAYVNGLAALARAEASP